MSTRRDQDLKKSTYDERHTVKDFVTLGEYMLSEYGRYDEEKSLDN